jgi:hypothetical protein
LKALIVKNIPQTFHEAEDGNAQTFTDSLCTTRLHAQTILSHYPSKRNFSVETAMAPLFFNVLSRLHALHYYI